MRKVTVAMKRELLGKNKNCIAVVVIIVLVFIAACKERWFKLKANFLFYYRLNEFGGVAKNEVYTIGNMHSFDIFQSIDELLFSLYRWSLIN